MARYRSEATAASVARGSNPSPGKTIVAPFDVPGKS